MSELRNALLQTGVVIEQKLSLIGKIAAACDAVGGVEKKGTNEMQRYKYVKAADIAKSIRHELFQRGVVLIADEKEFLSTGEIPTKSGGMLREFTLKVEYTLLDSDSDAKIVSTAYGVAMDSGDKAIYKCKTGALKYFLRGLGLIPDEKDDPEADSDVDAKIKDAEKRFDQRELAQQRISPTQVKAFWKAVREGEKSEAQVRAYLTEIGPYVQTEEIKQGEFNEAVRWCTNPVPVPQDLLPALSESLDMANARKRTVEAANLTDAQKAAVGIQGSTAASFISKAKPPVDPFWKSFWVMAKRNNVSEADIHQYAKENLGMEKSLTELDPKKLAVLANWISTVQP